MHPRIVIRFVGVSAESVNRAEDVSLVYHRALSIMTPGRSLAWLTVPVANSPRLRWPESRACSTHFTDFHRLREDHRVPSSRPPTIRYLRHLWRMQVLTNVSTKGRYCT